MQLAKRCPEKPRPLDFTNPESQSKTSTPYKAFAPDGFSWIHCAAVLHLGAKSTIWERALDVHKSGMPPNRTSYHREDKVAGCAENYDWSADLPGLRPSELLQNLPWRGAPMGPGARPSLGIRADKIVCRLPFDAIPNREAIRRFGNDC